MLKNRKNYFTLGEKMLWCGSVGLILVAFAAFDRENYGTLLASLVGVTSLLFNAKGHPLGQGLMVVFSLLYGGISFGLRYYGEMLTYLGMTMPMAVCALISWVKNPYEGGKGEVKVNALRKGEAVGMWALAAVVTAVFFVVLKHFHTANLLPATLSVTTSFVAVYLTFRRSPYFALAYAANDLVLILLWSLACGESIRYLSVVVCFAAFFVNDLYGFFRWQKRKLAQARPASNLREETV